MEDFIFHEGIVPSRYSFSFTESIFNREAHRQLQSKSNWRSFFILNQKNNSVLGTIHFHVQDGIAHSPFRATHGGFDLAENIPHKIILSFVAFIEQQLKKTGVTKIAIKLPLRLNEQNEFSLIEDVLRRSGFGIVRKDEGCILKVMETFENRIHSRKRKRLEGAIKSNFRFDKVDLDELEVIYLFLQHCRRAKNYDLSMSWEEVYKLANQFPGEIILFTVLDGDRLIAASISIRMSTSTLYDFYHDHDASYDAFSPIIFLIKGIHDFARASGIAFIDLGTAMNGDEVNKGLLEFKLELGADHAVKYSFEKNYL